MTNRIDPTEAVAIVGMGGLFPKALSIAEFWENVKGRRDCIVEVPADRWDWRLYYDPNPAAPDKTYSKIGGFVEGFKFDPLKLRIPPPVAAQMDTVQHMAVAAVSAALTDSGYDKKPFDPERTAVVLGNSMGGPKKEQTDLRVYTSFYADRLKKSPSFAKLPEAARGAILAEVEKEAKSSLSTITEDTMPGELSNVIAGRVANAFNFNGANITVDAACASSLAALNQAVHGLRFHEFDVAISGGVDQMMSAPAYVKFCKIGALSPDGSRPFDAGANGFVMGEGAGIFVLKRLSDALRDGDRVYALIRAAGSSSDGRGKGITAPNPKGQRLAIERCFRQLNYGPEGVGLLEAHGTSTKVGDVVEVNAAAEFFGKAAAKGSIGLGSVKSQIGHLKAAAGAAAVAKAALALHHKVLPPSINFKTPNPGIDWANSPFRVVTAPQEWKRSTHPRRAHVSSFGFGGTNFHLALEEAEPDTVNRIPDFRLIEAAGGTQKSDAPHPRPLPVVEGGGEGGLPPSILNLEPMLGGEAFFLHGGTPDAIFDKLKALSEKAAEGPLTALAREVNAGRKRQEYVLSVAAESAAKLKEKAEFVLRSKDASIFTKASPLYKTKSLYPNRRKKPGKIGFMFPGQGSQYVDMLKDLRGKYQVVADTFAEADGIMQGIIGEKLSDILFTKGGETVEQIAAMEERIKQTEITQPAVLTADVAILRLLKSYGVEPDLVVGHSLGEYGALVAAGIFTFEDALLAVSSRAKEMAGVKVADPGKMASIAAPLEKVEPVLKQIKGYVAPANKNCPIQTVIAGETKAVEAAVKKFQSLGIQAVEIRVSHAFHSKIVQPAQEAYGRFLDRMPLKKPQVPILSNVTAAYYPEDLKEIRRLLVAQIAEPVEFIRQVERMYKDGVRLFVEVGPKRVLSAFATSILEGKPDAAALSSNHPKRGGVLEFNDLLARLEAEGVDLKLDDKRLDKPGFYTEAYRAWAGGVGAPAAVGASPHGRGAGEGHGSLTTQPITETSPQDLDRFGFFTGPVVVSGIAAGTPGAWDRVFREDSLDQIIRGQNLIGKLSDADLERQIDKNIVRVVKDATGNHRLDRIHSAAEVVKLAACAGEFDLAKEFGFKDAIAHAMDVSSRLAVAAGILALKDAGIPLVRAYKQTTTGSKIPTGWLLPEPLRDETGIIFATAYPSLDAMASEVSRYLADKYRRKPLRELSAMLQSLLAQLKSPEDRAAVEHWMATHFATYQERHGNEGHYEFSRDFLLRVMPLGHSQLAQWIGARGPSVQVSAACASTTQAVAMAEDWIRLGRAKRVIVMAGDDVTSPNLREWTISGFLAAGAATTTGVVSEAALPFDRRRHGMILGMGAAGIVVEDGSKAAERGMRPLTEILASQFMNSAFHAVRLETQHVGEVMEKLIAKAERRWGLKRADIASKALFMSHETYTPARGGSASAEVLALKRTFGPDASRIVVANTKGFTGHSMGASIEDPVAIRSLVTGQVPPIANYREPDPDLAGITLSRGGEYDLEYALRLGAGFGSQIAMTLMRRVLKKGEQRVADPNKHLKWLRRVSGQENPELEVVQNTLRVRERGGVPSPSAAPAPAAPSYEPRPAAPAPVAVTGERRSAEEGRYDRPLPARPTPGPQVALDEESVRQAVVALVGEKTGYPAEMLELDLDMEADLGIDTVKQAEMIGIIREKYGIPKQENLSLKDYPTLRHVIRFVLTNTGGNGNGAASAAPSNGVEVPAQPRPPVQPETPSPIPAPEPQIAPAAPAASGAALNEAEVRPAVIELVSQKTGYPAEMLELDLDMEADLGIDTVKQAEMIGIIREKYGIPKQENLSLKDYPTLRHVIGFVLKNAGAAAPAAASAEGGQAAAAAPADFKRWALVEREQALPKGKSPLPKAGVLVVAANAAEAKPFQAALKKAGSEATFVAASADPESSGKAARKALGSSKPAGVVYVVGALPEFEKMGSDAFEKAYRQAVVPLFALAKALGPDLDAAAGFLAVVTSGGMEHPLAGAAAGLAKALRRELTRVRVHTLAADKAPAEALVAELAAPFTAGEAAVCSGKRYALRLTAAPAGPATAKLGPKSVVVVTGGGQGLGAECAKEIARRLKSKLFVIGRTALDKDAAEWAAMSAAELKELKAKRWEELKADKKVRATPALLEREFSKVTKAAELHRNLEAMRQAGATVTYLAADLADEDAVAAAAKKIGAADLILHAAGLEESKLLADKTVERFDVVFKAKAHGAFYLLRHLKPKKDQRWVLFSSVVGRFGNVGQTDYAAASEFLAGLSGWLRARGTKAVTVDLTAIAEIGMATRGGVEQFLKSQGVDFMPPKTAVELILAEAFGPMKDAEVVLAGRLGKLDIDGLMSGGPAAPQLSAQKVADKSADSELAARRVSQPTVSQAARPLPKGKVLVDSFADEEPGKKITGHRTFSLEADPWLADHSISGVPYVAGVMGLELFAATSGKLNGTVPGGFSDVRFSLPIKLLRNKPTAVRVKADGAKLSIESDFITPQGLKLGGPRVHFTANALPSGAPSWDRPQPSVKKGALVVQPTEIYSAYFHGPSFQVLEGFLSVSEKESLAVYRKPSKPLWAAEAPKLLFEPMLIEAAFQACGFRDLKFTKKMTLPDSIGRVLVQPHGAEPERLYIHTVYKGPEGEQKSVYDAYVFDDRGRVWAQLTDYRMIAVS